MKKKSIQLEKEKETLLIPLYSKSVENQKKIPIIVDEKAVEIVSRLNYDYSQLRIPKQTHVTLCMRAKQLDNYVKEFMQQNAECVVVHLGCGLDSRFIRVDNGKVEWYDLDYPEVIELRKSFYQESDRYHLIPSSVVEFKWMDNLIGKKGPFLFLAEGLFMYLREKEVKALVLKLQKAFPGCQLIFDSYSAFTVKKIKNHPSIRKTDARIYWGIDNAHEIKKWKAGIQLRDEWYFTQSEDINKLGVRYRLLFKLAGLFSVARKAHRILVFQLY